MAGGEAQGSSTQDAGIRPGILCFSEVHGALQHLVRWWVVMESGEWESVDVWH